MVSRYCFVLSLLLSGLIAPINAQDAPVELSILWFDDGNESVALQALLNDFEAANPDIRVELDITLTFNGQEALTELVARNTLPDLARHTSLALYREYYLDLRPYLDNAEDWDANFPAPLLTALRPDPTANTLHGFPTDITVSAPFVNYTLFQRAGVPVPGADGEPASWEAWTAAAAAVQQRLVEQGEGVYGITMDRSGHRFWGMSLGQCTGYLAADGTFNVDTPGFRRSAAMLRDWHTAGITPPNVWGALGDAYVEPSQLFADGQVAVYYSGSWLIPVLANTIMGDFDWGPAPNPGTDCGRAGMVGGAVLTAFNSTEHPEAVGRLMSFLTTEDNLAVFYGQSGLLPGHHALAARGLAYDANADALNLFSNELATIQDEAFRLQYHPRSTAYHDAVRLGLTEMIVQELTLDETIAAIEANLTPDGTE